MKRSSVQLFILAFMAISIAIARGQNFTLIGKQCPADLSTYRPIDGNELCDPHGRNIKACNDNYEGMAWQACYQRVIDCRDRVVEQNRKIAEYNNWMGTCQAERDKGNTTFALGRAILSTKPLLSGSETFTNTIGIVRVSRRRASAHSEFVPKITFGAKLTSCAA
jgi:hypothetical protein